MIVVSDTSVINYLILLDEIILLPQLFSSAIIPRGVVEELLHPSSSAAVWQWAGAIPDWVDVRQVEAAHAAMKLGRGEAQAITLAERLKPDFVLLDDRKARRIAEARGLTVTGTLGVLRMAAERGLIDLSDAINRLRTTSFRVDEALLDALTSEPTRERPTES